MGDGFVFLGPPKASAFVFLGQSMPKQAVVHEALHNINPGLTVSLDNVE